MQDRLLPAIICLVIGLGLGFGLATLLADDSDGQPILGTRLDANQTESSVPDSKDPVSNNASSNSRPSRPAKPKPDGNVPAQGSGESAAGIGPMPVPVVELPPVPTGTLTLNGRVELEDGTPLAGATVYVLVRGNADPVYDPDQRAQLDGLPTWLSVADRQEAQWRRVAENYQRSKHATREVLSDSDGRFAFTGLPDEQLTVAGSMKGYSFSRSGVRCFPGDDVVLTAEAIFEITLALTLPDGSIPSGADVRASAPNSRGRGVATIWLPDQPTIQLTEGIYDLIATFERAGIQYRGTIEDVDVSSAMFGQTLTIALGSEPEVSVTVVLPFDTDASVAVRFFALADGVSASLESFRSGTIWFSMSGTGLKRRGQRFLDPGRYAFGAGWGSQAMSVFKEVIVGDEPVSMELELPEPDRTGRVELAISVPQGRPVRNPRFRIEERSSGRNRSSNTNAIQLKNGNWLVDLERRNPTEPEPSDVSYTITVSLEGFGDASVSFGAGATQLSLAFEEPGKAIFALRGASTLPAGSRLQVAVYGVKDDRTRDSRRIDNITISSDGSGTSKELATGSYFAVLMLSRSGNSWRSSEVSSVEFTLGRGETTVTLDTPVLYDLRVTLPVSARDASVYLAMQTGSSNSFRHLENGRGDSTGSVIFEGLAAGRYRLTRSGGPSKTIELPADSVVVLE